MIETEFGPILQDADVETVIADNDRNTQCKITREAFANGNFFKGELGVFFEGDPYVTYKVPKCVSDD